MANKKNTNKSKTKSDMDDLDKAFDSSDDDVYNDTENGQSVSEGEQNQDASDAEVRNERTDHPFQPYGYDLEVDERAPQSFASDDSLRSRQEIPIEQYNPWVEQRRLPEIPARDGMRQKWIRVENAGITDASNIARNIGPGRWQPRNPATIPAHFSHILLKKHAHFGDVVMAHGLILCEAPEESIALRQRAIDARTNRLMEAVEHDLRRVQVPGHPIANDSSSRSSRGNRNSGRVIVAPDK